MSWLGTAWRRRVAITLDNTGANASDDYDIEIPPWFDEFWSAIDSSGNELRVTHANGITVADYDVDDGAGGSFDQSGRAGRIRLNNFAAQATASMVLCWLYFDPSSTQGSGAGTAGSGTGTGYIELGQPSQHVVLYQPQRPGLARPRDVRTKTSSEQVQVWFDLTAMLERVDTAARGKRLYEEPWFASVASYDSGGSSASLESLADTRFVSSRRRVYLRTEVSGGSSGSAYSMAASVHTVHPRTTTVNTLYRILEPRVGFVVRDVLQDT